MTSIGQQIQKLAGLVGTSALNPWATKFVNDIMRKTDNGKRTTHLTQRQVEVIDELHEEHFG